MNPSFLSEESERLHITDVTNEIILGTPLNDFFYDTDGDDIMKGFAGNDRFTASGGDDRLIGGAGNDWLFDGDGNDWLIGGTGEDRLAGGSGNDMLKGGKDVDRMQGGDDNDTLYGGADRDWLEGNNGNDTLFGGVGDDHLYGDSPLVEDSNGDDWLDSGTGSDYMNGGAGNDTYVLTLGGHDSIYNYGGSLDTIDRVLLKGGVSPDQVTLVRDVDALLFLINGTTDQLRFTYFFAGAELSDEAIDSIKFEDGTVWDRDYLASHYLVIIDEGNNTIYGTAEDDVIDGLGGSDWLYGLDGNDTLIGGDGDDLLSGGDGDDIMNGGAGDDRMAGDAGNDVLGGRAGNDTMAGYSGSDLFVFDTALSDTDNVDRIFDYELADSIVLKQSIFAGLVPVHESEMDPFNFVANESGEAMDADDFIVYQTATGNLYYDADGNGAGAKVQFATLVNKAALTAGEFFII